jgi:hypothetical protein
VFLWLMHSLFRYLKFITKTTNRKILSYKIVKCVHIHRLVQSSLDSRGNILNLCPGNSVPLCTELVFVACFIFLIITLLVYFKTYFAYVRQ